MILTIQPFSIYKWWNTIETSFVKLSFPPDFIISSTSCIYTLNFIDKKETFATIKIGVEYGMIQSNKERTEGSTKKNTKLLSTSNVLPSWIRNNVSFNNLHMSIPNLQINPSLFDTLPNKRKNGLLIRNEKNLWIVYFSLNLQ